MSVVFLAAIERRSRTFQIKVYRCVCSSAAMRYSCEFRDYKYRLGGICLDFGFGHFPGEQLFGGNRNRLELEWKSGLQSGRRYELRFGIHANGGD